MANPFEYGDDLDDFDDDSPPLLALIIVAVVMGLAIFVSSKLSSSA